MDEQLRRRIRKKVMAYYGVEDKGPVLTEEERRAALASLKENMQKDVRPAPLGGSDMQKETNQTMIPRNAAWQCAECRKHIPFTVTCEAYPAGIPKEIKSGKAICKEREKAGRR